MKRTSLAAVVPAFLLTCTSVLAETSANKKYCLNPTSGGSSCAFDSMEQCYQTMRGRNGWCSGQVDFGAWQESHTQTGSAAPENSYAHYAPSGRYAPRRISPAEKKMEELHKKDVPTKGVGAE